LLHLNERVKAKASMYVLKLWVIEKRCIE